MGLNAVLHMLMLIGLNVVLLFHIQVLLMGQDTVLHNQVLVGLSAVLLVQVLMCLNAVLLIQVLLMSVAGGFQCCVTFAGVIGGAECTAGTVTPQLLLPAAGGHAVLLLPFHCSAARAGHH